MLEVSIKPNQKKDFRNRIFFIIVLTFTLLFDILVYVAYIQVVERNVYKKFAQGQTEQRIPVHAFRGLIYDRKGDVIVDNRLAYSLYITPAYFPKSKTKNGDFNQYRKNLLGFLSKKLEMPVKSIIKKITIQNHRRQNKYQPVLIKRDINPNTFVEIKENIQNIQGVEVIVTSMRRHVMGADLAHVLGYTGVVSYPAWLRFQKKFQQNQEKNPYRYKDTITGKKGLELYQDNVLRGEDGVAIRLVNSVGKSIPNSYKIIKKSLPGNNLYLTIDKRLQEIARRAMNHKKGAILVTKPSTGEILAFVSSPSFDPKAIMSRNAVEINKINKDPDNPLFNRVLQGRYHPGSTFKVIVAIAALEEKNVSPNKSFACSGEVALGNRIFKCHDRHGIVNFSQAIEKSCNSYFYQLGAEIGWNAIYKYAKLFGLDHQFNLEFGISQPSIVPNEKWKKKFFNESWFPGDTLNHSIGQGYLQLAPIHLHNIMSILANNGVLYKPYIVKKIIDPTKTIKLDDIKKILHLIKNKKITDPDDIREIVDKKENIDISIIQKIITLATDKQMTDPQKIQDLIIPLSETTIKPQILKKINLSKRTVDILLPALRSVVEKGTGSWAKYSEKYEIAGKTGTAQNAVGDPHAWFISYGPYNTNNPDERIVVTVIVENGKQGGGFVAAPISAAIFKYYYEGTSLAETQEKMGRSIFDISEENDQNGNPVKEITSELDKEKRNYENSILQEINNKYSSNSKNTRAENLNKSSEKIEQKENPNKKSDKKIDKKIDDLNKTIQKLQSDPKAKQKSLEEIERQKEKLRKLQEQKDLENRKKLIEQNIRTQKEKQRQLLLQQHENELRRIREQNQKQRELENQNKKNNQTNKEPSKNNTTSEKEENKRLRKLMEQEERKLKKELEVNVDE